MQNNKRGKLFLIRSLLIKIISESAKKGDIMFSHELIRFVLHATLPALICSIPFHEHLQLLIVGLALSHLICPSFHPLPSSPPLSPFSLLYLTHQWSACGCRVAWRHQL